MQEYWKAQLTPAQKVFYGDMLSAFRQYRERVGVHDLTPQEISAAYVAVYNDHPELYHLSNSPQIAQSMSWFGRNTELLIENIYTPSQIRSFDGQIARIKSELLARVPASASEADRERAVCDFIIENVTYEIDNRFHQNAASVLVNHRGQCSGIAKAAMMMLGWLGIEAIVVNGEGMDSSTGQCGPHAWNIVWIGSKCYHLDPTYLLGANTSRQKPYRYLYFNITDAEAEEHHRWARQTVPRCDTAWPKESAAANNRSSCTAPQRSAQTISSLYDFKQQFRAAILSNKNGFEFESAIPVGDGELLKSVRNACKMVIDTIGKGMQVSISVRGNFVSLKW